MSREDPFSEIIILRWCQSLSNMDKKLSILKVMGRSVMIYNWPWSVGGEGGGSGAVATRIDINESIYRLIGSPLLAGA